MKRFLNWLKKLITGYEEIPCPKGEPNKCLSIKGVPLKCKCREDFFKRKIELYNKLAKEKRGNYER